MAEFIKGERGFIMKISGKSGDKQRFITGYGSCPPELAGRRLGWISNGKTYSNRGKVLSYNSENPGLCYSNAIAELEEKKRKEREDKEKQDAKKASKKVKTDIGVIPIPVKSSKKEKTEDSQFAEKKERVREPELKNFSPEEAHKAFMWFFIGAFGILGFHRFALGKIKSGLLWLFTGGLFFGGAIYDGIILWKLSKQSGKGMKRILIPAIVGAVLLIVIIAIGAIQDSGKGDIEEIAISERTNETRTPEQPVESSQPVATPINITDRASVSATSTLPTSSNANYKPVNLIDGNPSTVWCENVDDVFGEKITFTFPQEIEFTRIGIIPGYDKGELWSQNLRLKSFGVKDEKLRRRSYTCSNSRTIQYFSIEGLSGKTLVLEIRSAYSSGARWQDLCIGEIEIFGVVK